MKEIVVAKKIVLVDDADYERVCQYKWHCNGNSIMRNIQLADKRGKQQMSNFILTLPSLIKLDHIDRDPLNNQKYNLRQCTHAQNNQNAVRRTGPCGFRGVIKYHYDKTKYVAQISLNGLQKHLGVFKSAEAAAKAYDVAAKELHGEFAVLNFI